MFINKDNFEDWMLRIMERFDGLENRLSKSKKQPETIAGENILDNQDLCIMFKCSKRTLQRYRVSGLLACRRIKQKTYYLESDVMKFVQEHLKKPKSESGK
jgi:hypothetical protein